MSDARLCPHCGIMSRFASRHNGGRTRWMNSTSIYSDWKIEQCDHCDGNVLLIDLVNISNGSAEKSIQYPSVLPRTEIEVPRNIAVDYISGVSCLNIGEYRAAATMFRRSLQTAMVELGADVNKKLYQQIDEMASQGKLTNDIKEWAHEIRYWGNDGAHPGTDGLTSMTSDDVLAQKEFLERLFDYVFVMPTRVAQSRTKRQSIS